MHPITCCAGQISLCHAKIEKISKKFFVMINKDGGGGGDTIFGFYGGHSCYEGEHRAHGGPGKTLPGMTVFGRSAVVGPAFKKQFYKELQTQFLIESNNKNNRTIETKQ